MERIVATLMGLAAIAGAVPGFDFASEAGKDAWRLRTPTDRLEWTRRFADAGQFSLCFRTPAWKKGMEQWPAFEAAPRVADWRAFDRLVIDIVNPQAEVPFLSLMCSDRKVPFRQGLNYSFQLPARGFRRFVVPLSGFPKAVDRGDIGILHFFTQRPAGDVALHIGRIELLKPGERLPEPGTELARQIVAMYLETAPSAAEYRRECEKPFAELAGVPGLRPAIDRELERLDDAYRAALAELRAPGIALARFEEIREDLASQPGKAARTVAELRFQSQFRELGLPGGDALAVGFATGMEKILPRDMPFAATVARETALSLARRETECFQVLVMPAGDKPLAGVRVNVGALRTPAGAEFPASGVSCEVMGYVRTERKPPYKVSYVGWWPDPILDFLGPVEIAPHTVQSFWIRLRAPEGQASGTYRGTLTVVADGQPAIPLELAVRVRDFALPRQTPLPTAITFFERKPQMGGDENWPARKFEYADFLADYYIDYDSLYRQGAPDFEIVDHLHKQGRLVAFNLGNVFNGGIKGDDVGAAIRATVERLRPAYEQAKARGLLDYAYIYGFDERGEDQFPLLEQCAKALREAFPEVLLMTTSYDHSFGLDSCVKSMDAWCPLTPRFDVARAEQARAGGKYVWWYICCGPRNPHANWFVEYAAIESRLLMGAMTAKYRPDGFLYYSLSIWNQNRPIENGPFTEWNPVSWTTYHGDGSLLCSGPGGKPVPTIRLENYRDGMEDYAYACILEECIRRTEAKPRRAAAENQWLVAARAALTVPESLVHNLAEYSRNPGDLLAWREAMADLIEQSGIRDADPWGPRFAARGFRAPTR